MVSELEDQQRAILAQAQKQSNDLKVRAEKQAPEAVGRIVEVVLPK